MDFLDIFIEAFPKTLGCPTPRERPASLGAWQTAAGLFFEATSAVNTPLSTTDPEAVTAAETVLPQPSSRQRPSIVSEKFQVFFPHNKKNGEKKRIPIISFLTKKANSLKDSHRYRVAHLNGLFCLKVFGAEDPQLYMTWSVKASKHGKYKDTKM